MPVTEPPKAGDTMVATIDHEAPCPFCGHTVQVDLKQCAVFHEMPPCKTYEEADDSLDFITKMRKERDRTAGMS